MAQRSTRSTCAVSRTANGDGIGDIAGIRARLPHLADLGIDAMWINPWYVSPQADAGYDVADYRDIDPLFGTLARRRRADARSARARHPRDRRHRSEPLLRGRTRGSRPRSPPGLAARSAPGSCSARAAARTATSRRTTGSPTSTARRGPGSPRPTARPASGTCISSHRSNPTSTGPTRRCAPSSCRCCGSGSTVASTGSASMWPTVW